MAEEWYKQETIDRLISNVSSLNYHLEEALNPFTQVNRSVAEVLTKLNRTDSLAAYQLIKLDPLNHITMTLGLKLLKVAYRAAMDQDRGSVEAKQLDEYISLIEMIYGNVNISIFKNFKAIQQELSSLSVDVEKLSTNFFDEDMDDVFELINKKLAVAKQLLAECDQHDTYFNFAARMLLKTDIESIEHQLTKLKSEKTFQDSPKAKGVIGDENIEPNITQGSTPDLGPHASAGKEQPLVPDKQKKGSWQQKRPTAQQSQRREGFFTERKTNAKPSLREAKKPQEPVDLQTLLGELIRTKYSEMPFQQIKGIKLLQKLHNKIPKPKNEEQFTAILHSAIKIKSASSSTDLKDAFLELKTQLAENPHLNKKEKKEFTAKLNSLIESLPKDNETKKGFGRTH